MNATTIEIEKLAKWSAPKEVNTRIGRKLLRKAAPTAEFSAAWKANRDAMKAAGLSWSKDERTGGWECCWWQSVSAGQAARENAAAFLMAVVQVLQQAKLAEAAYA